MKGWFNIISAPYVAFIAMVDHLSDVQQNIDVINTVFKVEFSSEQWFQNLNFSLGFDMSLCPHCGLELTESVQPKPQKIDEKISGMITLPSEHSSHFYYKPKDPVRMNNSSLTH